MLASNLWPTFRKSLRLQGPVVYEFKLQTSVNFQEDFNLIILTVVILADRQVIKINLKAINGKILSQTYFFLLRNSTYMQNTNTRPITVTAEHTGLHMPHISYQWNITCMSSYVYTPYRRRYLRRQRTHNDIYHTMHNI